MTDESDLKAMIAETEREERLAVMRGLLETMICVDEVNDRLESEAIERQRIKDEKKKRNEVGAP